MSGVGRVFQRKQNLAEDVDDLVEYLYLSWFRVLVSTRPSGQIISATLE